ncbi:hypothetical protein MXB_9 [Myxobolus squamalis]|nr:hypothetical protein MXB_9 [Myxobolus squamalis]
MPVHTWVGTLISLVSV